MAVPLFVPSGTLVGLHGSRSSFVQTCRRSRFAPATTRTQNCSVSHPSYSRPASHQWTSPRMMKETETESGTDSLGLPPVLRKYVDAFAVVPDPKLRYQQLLFLAKELPAMDSALKTDGNRVYGCTSVVHVHVSVDDKGHVHLQGDSDSQLTKGLLALLVNGLEGCEPGSVAKIDPKFISVSGLTTSLTPSRNNGFVSMLAKIKEQVAQLNSDTSSADDSGNDKQENDGEQEVDEDPSRPIYSALKRKLSVLRPVQLKIIDNSAQHAGHAGAKGLNGESHFAVAIVAEAFDGLSMVQRHRVIYTLMNEEMSEGYIHALQIDARTPSEI